MSKTKILLISYYWPPSSGSGVQRWLYFAKFLSEKNLDLRVITVDPRYASYRNIDDGLSALVSNIEVIRTKTLEPIKLYSRIMTGSSTKGIPQGHVGEKHTSIFGKLANWTRANIFVPDARVGWVRYAFKRIESFVLDDTPDIIITTGPPHSSHLIGLKLKRKYKRIKWLVDFRDPWQEIFFEHNLPRTEYSKTKNARLEKEVISECDHLLTVGPGMKDLFIKKGFISADNISFIYNGFDSDKMKKIRPDKKKCFTMAFVGTVAENMSFGAIIEALTTLNLKNTSIELAGNISEEHVNIFQSALGNYYIDFKGFVSHDEALRIMKSAHIVFTSLANAVNDELLISGKLMEYLSSETPTLVLGNINGDAARIMKDITYAEVIAHGDTKSVKTFIDTIYRSYLLGEPLKNTSEEIQKYSRSRTADELVELLDTIVQNG